MTVRTSKAPEYRERRFVVKTAPGHHTSLNRLEFELGCQFTDLGIERLDILIRKIYVAVCQVFPADIIA
jgi:hypothetical protein